MLSDLFFSLLKINAMATIVAIIVLVLKYILKKCGASRKLLFYLWIIIALRFVCPNFLESNFSLFNVFDTPISEENQIIANQNNQVNLEDNIHIGTNVVADNTNINNVVPSDVIVNSEVDETIQIANAEDIIQESQNNKIKTTDILMIAWITGSCFMILYALVSYLKLKKTVMFAVKGDGDYYETDMISTPCVVGIIKPRIYLTLNLSEKEKKYILTHENIHIKRKDYFTKLIAYLILTIHWINPICWILFKMFVNDMEMLCDEESIKKLGSENKVGYMESLVNLSSRNMKNILPCPIAFSENNTEKRVKNMIKYKKSGIVISIIALVVCVIIAAVCLTNGNKQEVTNIDEENNVVSSNNKVEIEKQLSVILNNKSLWYKDTEVEKYSYAVTDFDKNGRMEIVSSICQGTGIYTYTEIYEINESMDGLTLCESNLLEQDSQADIIKNSWKVFYDNTNNKYHYIFDDLTKNGVSEYYENKRDFCLSNGKIEERYLAYKTTIYQNGVPKVTYTDSENKEINEAEYNNIENKIFENYEKMIVNIEWLTNYTEIKLENLQSSYNSFLIYKVENFEYIEIPEDEKITYIMKEGMQEEVNYVGVKSSFGYTIQYDNEELSLVRENSKDFYRANLEDMKEKVYFTIEYLETSYEELKNKNKDKGIQEFEINGQKAFEVNFVDGVLWDENQNFSWDSDVENLIYVDGIEGTYLISMHYFMEASEGWGVSMRHMINTFKIIKTNNNDDAKKEAYIKAIKELYHNYTLPDGTKLDEVELVSDYDMTQNQFAIYDVDFDGKDELIIALTNPPMAAMRSIIYDYDSSTNKFREQLTEFTSINFYNNGVIEVLWSHNQGSAGDSLWPYTMYKYNNESDSYDVIAQVDAWDKSFNEQSYIADTFPEEIDRDSDGIVYYILPKGEYNIYAPYDLQEYNEWRKQYITDETSKITVPYINLTEDNINNI